MDNADKFVNKWLMQRTVDKKQYIIMIFRIS